MRTLPDDEFHHHELTPDSLVIALPDTHPLAKRDSIALRELADDRFILPASDVAEVLHNAVPAQCADSGFKPKRIQEVSTAQTALGIVSAGFSISVFPAAVRVLSREGVVLRPIRNSRLQIHLALLWPGNHPSPIIPKLIECLL